MYNEENEENEGGNKNMEKDIKILENIKIICKIILIKDFINLFTMI